MVLNLSIGFQNIEPAQDSQVGCAHQGLRVVTVQEFCFAAPVFPPTASSTAFLPASFLACQKKRGHSVLLADMLLIKEDEAPEILTTEAKRRWVDIHFDFDEEEEDDDKATVAEAFKVNKK
jgi:hypothetical protein